MSKTNPRIFIVHPWETARGTWDVSYGPNYNKTNRGFKTKQAAFTYARNLAIRIGEDYALVDSPSGHKVVMLFPHKRIRKVRSTRRIKPVHKKTMFGFRTEW